MWLRLQKAKERRPERLSLKVAAISRTKPKANQTLTATAWRMLEAATGLTAEIAAVAAVVPAAAVVIVVAAVGVEGPVVVGGIVDAVGLAGEDTKLSLQGSRGCFAIRGPRVVDSSGKRLSSSTEAGTVCDALRHGLSRAFRGRNQNQRQNQSQRRRTAVSVPHGQSPRSRIRSARSDPTERTLSLAFTDKGKAKPGLEIS
jgi:hypothetical protein